MEEHIQAADYAVAQKNSTIRSNATCLRHMRDAISKKLVTGLHGPVLAKVLAQIFVPHLPEAAEPAGGNGAGASSDEYTQVSKTGAVEVVMNPVLQDFKETSIALFNAPDSAVLADIDAIQEASVEKIPQKITTRDATMQNHSGQTNRWNGAAGRIRYEGPPLTFDSLGVTLALKQHPGAAPWLVTCRVGYVRGLSDQWNCQGYPSVCKSLSAKVSLIIVPIGALIAKGLLPQEMG